jgi:hypothetical protein
MHSCLYECLALHMYVQLFVWLLVESWKFTHRLYNPRRICGASTYIKAFASNDTCTHTYVCIHRHKHDKSQFFVMDYIHRYICMRIPTDQNCSPRTEYIEHDKHAVWTTYMHTYACTSTYMYLHTNRAKIVASEAYTYRIAIL